MTGRGHLDLLETSEQGDDLARAAVQGWLSRIVKGMRWLLTQRHFLQSLRT